MKNLRRQLTSEGGVVLEDDRAPSWAIQRFPSALERILWAGRGVKIYDLDLDQFVKRLSEMEEKV